MSFPGERLEQARHPPVQVGMPVRIGLLLSISFVHIRLSQRLENGTIQFLVAFTRHVGISAPRFFLCCHQRLDLLAQALLIFQRRFLRLMRQFRMLRRDGVQQQAIIRAGAVRVFGEANALLASAFVPARSMPVTSNSCDG